ncbi:MAG TPA: hypothetical protein VNY24_16515 [Candidatus Acidoferrales bacterium]|nr:hypothetical protein [Candidatus Acidoferrales bacterium]
MTRHLCAAVTLGLLSFSIPLRAANRPHAGTDRRNPVVWANEDLEKLHALGLISIVGRVDEDRPASASVPEAYVRTQDPEWYATQATKLHSELEDRQAQLREYRLALDDARSLRETAGGVSLDDGDAGITPEAGIEFLQQRVNETQAELDALEDLARHNGIPPGALRGQ